MITSRIMTNRMTSPTAMQVQPRGTSTSNKASAFASDPAVQRALGTVFPTVHNDGQHGAE